MAWDSAVSPPRWAEPNPPCAAGCAAPLTPTCHWAYQHGAARLIALHPDAFTELRLTGNPVRDTLQVLAAAAYWDARVCGFDDPPWALIGMYTRGRLLAPPGSG